MGASCYLYLEVKTSRRYLHHGIGVVEFVQPQYVHCSKQDTQQSCVIDLLLVSLRPTILSSLCYRELCIGGSCAVQTKADLNLLSLLSQPSNSFDTQYFVVCI